MRAQEAPVGPTTGTGRRRVVLIEDEPDIAEAIGYQLQKVGLEVKVARTGEEGLHAVRAGADLVLLTGPGSYPSVYRRLLATVRRSPSFRARLRAAAARASAIAR